MKQINKIIYTLLLWGICLNIVNGQATIPSTGGSAGGSGGSANFTVGQLVFNVYNGATGFVIQGVQQPYEISVITAIENSEEITLVCTVYPNPTAGNLKLEIKSYEYDNISYLLYDMNGVVLQDKKIHAEETEISMASLSSSIYFLKIIKDKMEVKVFKIIKK